jgi:hypothetical protein
VATDTEIIKATIERLQRAQPRNPDLLLVCEELQARLTASPSPREQIECPVCAARRAARAKAQKAWRKRMAEGGRPQ